ncbi:MAG: ferrous iron transport protein A [Vicinamibacteria bacterium]|nr:ferrous iron transport protein A [Vicinamibacteria bacterium]
MNERPLSHLSSADEAEIVAIKGGTHLRARLNALGIFEGQRLRLLSGVGRYGPVVVIVNRAHVALGRGMAAKIIVRVAV